jgi:hypothetical protein
MASHDHRDDIFTNTGYGSHNLSSLPIYNTTKGETHDLPPTIGLRGAVDVTENHMSWLGQGDDQHHGGDYEHHGHHRDHGEHHRDNDFFHGHGDHHHVSTPAIHGTPGDDALTIRPGDIAFTGRGDDTITISPVIGTGDVTGPDRAFVFGGPGNDMIIDQSIKENPFPVTASGGPGNDTFTALSGADPSHTTFFTGGPGHDVFEFSTQPFEGASNVTITDFSRHDAIKIDVNAADPPTIDFTNNGAFTDLTAMANGATVDLHLAGHFDPSQFHVANDGQGHDIITYGQGHSDWLLS